MFWCARVLVGFGVMAALGAMASPASSQTLGDLARLEEARRKTVKAPAKVYTNDSLPTIPGETIPTPPGPGTASPVAAADAGAKLGTAPAAIPASGGTAPGAAPSAPVVAPEQDPKTPEYWRKRIGDARELRDRNKVYLEALQSRINGLLTDFTARDDPAQRTVIAADRQRALAELDRLTKEQQDLEKQIAGIEEEARRAGVPTAWVR
jgi:hypothetical protein